jgi:hypothetical protein
MLCYGFLNKRSPHAGLRFPAQMSPLAPCHSGRSQSMMPIPSSTTCHDGINHCSKHNIDPHHDQITSRWTEDHNTLPKTQANSTSQMMKELYDTQDCMTKQNYRSI